MDPSQTLQALRKAVKDLLQIADGDQSDIDFEDMDRESLVQLAKISSCLAEDFENLDKWLSKGGFLPGAWGPSTEPQPGDVCERTESGKHIINLGTLKARGAPDDHGDLPIEFECAACGLSANGWMDHPSIIEEEWS